MARSALIASASAAVVRHIGSDAGLSRARIIVTVAQRSLKVVENMSLADPGDRTARWSRGFVGTHVHGLVPVALADLIFFDALLYCFIRTSVTVVHAASTVRAALFAVTGARVGAVTVGDDLL